MGVGSDSWGMRAADRDAIRAVAPSGRLRSANRSVSVAVRRVVTGLGPDGASIVVSDTIVEGDGSSKLQGGEVVRLWMGKETCVDSHREFDISWVPGPGEVRFGVSLSLQRLVGVQVISRRRDAQHAQHRLRGRSRWRNDLDAWQRAGADFPSG